MRNRCFAIVLWVVLAIVPAAAVGQSTADTVRSTTYAGALRPITEPLRLRIAETPRHRFVMTSYMSLSASGKPAEKVMPLAVTEGKLLVESGPAGLVFRMDVDAIQIGQQKLQASAPLARLSAPIAPDGEMSEVDGDFPGLSELGLPGKGSPMADAMMQSLSQMALRFAPVINKVGDLVTDESPQQLFLRSMAAAEQQGVDLDATVEATGGSYAAGLTTFRGIDVLVAQTDAQIKVRTNDGTAVIRLAGYTLSDLRNGNLLDMVLEIRMGTGQTDAPFEISVTSVMDVEPLQDGGI